MTAIRTRIVAAGMTLAAFALPARASGADAVSDGQVVSDGRLVDVQKAQQDYWRAMAGVCSTGVTRTLVEAHQALTAALDKEFRPAETFVISGPAGPLARRVILVRTGDTPRGPVTNFWSPPRPEHASALCVQAR